MAKVSKGLGDQIGPYRAEGNWFLPDKKGTARVKRLASRAAAVGGLPPFNPDNPARIGPRGATRTGAERRPRSGGIHDLEAFAEPRGENHPPHPVEAAPGGPSTASRRIGQSEIGTAMRSFEGYTNPSSCKERMTIGVRFSSSPCRLRHTIRQKSAASLSLGPARSGRDRPLPATEQIVIICCHDLPDLQGPCHLAGQSRAALLLRAL